MLLNPIANLFTDIFVIGIAFQVIQIQNSTVFKISKQILNNWYFQIYIKIWFWI